ncbi:hypothetical protein BSKO_00681 [Bryopsis sp. KO-2023]|nr:hypothetical protein BSKO_00681 [Bryopsis sp. KO-2023]
MAEAVQAMMESMVPGIEALEEKGYFSQGELKQVISKRLQFEYLIKGAAKKKEDFMSYIEYEMKLEELRQIRRKSGPPGRGDEPAENCIKRHIHGIFARAARLYKGDVQLWIEWIQFCKQTRSNSRLSKTLTQALRYNPQCADLWIAAGQWEFNERANPNSARALMLQAIRMCPNSRLLWLEYFKMEVAYARRLSVRRKILGIDMEEPDPENLEEEAQAMKTVLSGGVALLVFQKALKNFPDDLEYRKQFLKHLSGMSDDATQEIATQIFASIVEDFPEDADAWDLRARFRYSSTLAKASQSEALNNATDVFLEGCSTAASEKLSDCHHAFLCEVWESIRQGGDEMEEEEGVTEKCMSEKMMECFDVAVTKKVASQALLMEWVQFLCRMKGAKGGLAAAKVATGLKPTCPGLWCLQIDLISLSETKHLTGEQIIEVFECALESIPADRCQDVWLHCLHALVGRGADLGPLKAKLLKEIIIPKGHQERQCFDTVLHALLLSVREVEGLSAAREFYSEASKGPGPSSQFFTSVISMEMAAADEGPEAEERMSQLFKKGIQKHPQDVNMWIEYAKFHRTLGRGLGEIYSRAMHAMDKENYDLFMDMYKGLN